jgi:hypothetical protein
LIKPKQINKIAPKKVSKIEKEIKEYLDNNYPSSTITSNDEEDNKGTSIINEMIF